MGTSASVEEEEEEKVGTNEKDGAVEGAVEGVCDVVGLGEGARER